MYSRAFLVAVSRDREAAAHAVRWRAEAGNARPWQRRSRQAAERRAIEAEDRAIAAGIDWDRLPRPAGGLHAPDRSSRQRLGRRLPPPDSPVPASGRTLFRRHPSRSGTGPPRADVVPPQGGGVASLAGQPVPGEVSGAGALQWLRSGAAAAHTHADGAAWFQATDGSLWHRDARGAHFALAADGAGLLPVSDEGLLYARDAAGTWHTSLADGTPLTLNDDGQLVGHGDDGSLRILADDGLFYLVTPAAMYPIAENGEVLADAGITFDGRAVIPDDVGGFDGGADVVGELWS
jgi:hypothetical protein